MSDICSECKIIYKNVLIEIILLTRLSHDLTQKFNKKTRKNKKHCITKPNLMTNTIYIASIHKYNYTSAQLHSQQNCFIIEEGRTTTTKTEEYLKQKCKNNRIL